MHLFMSTGAPSSSDSDSLPLTDQNQLCLTILSISTSRKKNPPLWCCLVYCLMYSSLLILQTRCFFFQWKVLTGEIFKVVLKANKLFLKNAFVLLVLCFIAVNKKTLNVMTMNLLELHSRLPIVGIKSLICYILIGPSSYDVMYSNGYLFILYT